MSSQKNFFLDYLSKCNVDLLSDCVTVVYTWNVTVLTSPKIIGYRENITIIVWASNAKISLTSKVSTSPNVKLLAMGLLPSCRFKPCVQQFRKFHCTVHMAQSAEQFWVTHIKKMTNIFFMTRMLALLIQLSTIMHLDGISNC